MWNAKNQCQMPKKRKRMGGISTDSKGAKSIRVHPSLRELSLASEVSSNTQSSPNLTPKSQAFEVELIGIRHANQRKMVAATLTRLGKRTFIHHIGPIYYMLYSLKITFL